MAENSSGTNGGQRRVSWEAARAYWLELGDERRTFTAVGARFGVSGERVGQIARRDGWANDLAELQALQGQIERAELTKELRRLARNRAERIGRTLEVYDRVTDALLEKLPLDDDGAIDVDALPDDLKLESLLSSLPSLFKMAELAAGEATDRVAIADVQPVLIAFARIAVMRAPADSRPSVMLELEQAAAGLVTLDQAAAG